MDPGALEAFFSSCIETNRLILRPYSEERDLDNIAELLADSRVTAPMGIPLPHISVDEIRSAKQKRAQDARSGDWTILSSDASESFAGEIGIAEWDVEAHVVSVFTAIHPDYRGAGIGREAMSKLMECIFGTSPIATVRIELLAANTPALKLGERLGFRITGRRFVPPDPILGFVGRNAVIMDCRAHEFKPFEPEIPTS